MMLSRVADALFWMSRYLERAEIVARLLDVNSSLDLDLNRLETQPRQVHWLAVADVLQAAPPTGAESLLSPEDLCRSFSFDLGNVGSIASCINRSRNNARSIRGSISSDMWRELNKLYWQVWDSDFRGRVKDAPHDLYQTVETGSHVFQGVCDSTLPHDEGWHFIQLGKYLELAEKTLRLLDARYQQLHSPNSPMEPSLLNLHWGSVLKCCLAFQAYQRLYISRVEAERVVDFLLFNSEFPHSVCFCLHEASKALNAISQGVPRTKAAQILGKAVSELEFADVEQLKQTGCKPLIDATLQRCLKASAALQEQYFLA